MNAVQARLPGRFPVFFIGASAGGVQALKYLAANIPAEFPAPLFFLLHRRRRSGHCNLLPGILRAVSQLPVAQPAEGEVVKSGRIYLPHDHLHLAVEDNRIRLLQLPDNEEWRPSIDVLFKSGARDYGDRAVSILLTGGLQDGIEGLKETTYQGGISVAQSPNDAYNPVLPLNALLNDRPAYVLPLTDLPALLCELADFQGFASQREVTDKAAIAAAQERQDLLKSTF